MRNEKLILGCGRLRYPVPSAEIRICKQSPVLPALVATERWRNPNAANLDGGEAMTGTPELEQLRRRVEHADAYANRCAEHAYCAAQTASATAKSYAEFAQIAERDKVAGYAEFGQAALYARYAASAAAEYATAAAKASPVHLTRRAKFNAEYAKYLARPTVRMPHGITEAEDKADIAALIKVADAAIELHRK